MPDHISLRYERPEQHYVTDLAPRVMARSPHYGYGYALCLTGAGKVRVLWDDGERDDDTLISDIAPSQLTFIDSRSTLPGTAS